MNNESKLVTAMTGIVGIQEHLVGLELERKSIGQRLLTSDNFKKFEAKTADLIRLDISPRELKTAITSTGTINDPLTPSLTPALDPGKRRTLSVRDLLPSFPTINAAIEMPVKSAATNNAGPQVNGSPLTRENVSFGESAYTFSTSFVPVETLGHMVPVSSQVMEDAGTLDALIHGELLYGLEYAVQDAILNGDGTTGQLDGLLTNATAYTLQSPNLTGEADIIRDAIKQIALADFNATAIVLNPNDWYDIDAALDTAGASRLILGGGHPLGLTCCGNKFHRIRHIPSRRF